MREKKTQQTNQTNNVPRVYHEVLPPTFVQNNRGSSRASFSKMRVTTNDHVNSAPPSTKKIQKRSSTPPQKAKSLISIFESKKSAGDAPPLLPQSEHWQYGKMRGG